MSDARVEAAAKAIMDDNPFNDEEGLWEVPTIRDHYMSIARAALAAADTASQMFSPKPSAEKIDAALPHEAVIET